MAKTCRTCIWCVKRPFAQVTIFDIGKERVPYVCETFMRGEIPEITLDKECDCIDFEARPPLLLDELAAALRFLWDRRYTDGDESGVTPGYTIRLTPAECDRVQAVLARHQKEVDDA